jgi:AcrR family transcriptional regulator
MKRATRSGASPTDARAAILEAAVDLLRSRRGTDITTDEVARKVGCAKGLVHYHFKGKDQLLAAAAERLWQQRADAWTGALGLESPNAAIRQAWETMVSESSNGIAASCATLGMRSEPLVVQSVSTGRAAFSRGIAAALEQMLAQLRLEPSVPTRELGALLVATIEGIGLQLGSGVPADEMEQAWSAFWAGLLSLTRPRRA